MSFRHPLITDFIYAGSDDFSAQMPAVTEVMKSYCTLSQEPDSRGMGYYAGMMRTSSLSLLLEEMGLEDLIHHLEKVTPVPFRLTVMQESGAVITYSVEPRS